MNAGDALTLTLEKPAAGGRMIARHDGAVVLVSGAIPGEVVEARVERVQRGTAWARTTHVIAASLDRVADTRDWACGGNVFAHVRYPRQLSLKDEIIRDAFTRIGRMPLESPVPVAASRTDGYRMRARLHRQGRRLGFFREGTHEWCPPAATGQLLPASLEVIDALDEALQAIGEDRVREVELAENCPADERALHLVLGPGGNPRRLQHLPVLPGVRGVSCAVGDDGGPRRVIAVQGTPTVSDTVTVPGGATVRLTRQAHSFFQGNRFLLHELVAAVLHEVPAGRVLDLYAGVGLFAIALAAAGGRDVTAIEGDRATASDLRDNAARHGDRVVTHHAAVEAVLDGGGLPAPDTIVVDPPRTGMTAAARSGALRLRPARLVYVSCDVATLARDARVIADAGYHLQSVRAFDLFPNTAHVETLAVFTRDA